MFFLPELGSKDLNDYKNCKAYSYKSGWLQPVLYYNLTGSQYCNQYCIITLQFLHPER